MGYCRGNLSDKYTLLDKFGQALATCERTSMVARDKRHGKI